MPRQDCATSNRGPRRWSTHKQNNETHCVTLCASRLRSSSFLTIARSPPRSEHCFRASVQLSSPGTTWKQREDSSCGTPSFGQCGEAGRGQKQPRHFQDSFKITQAASQSQNDVGKRNENQNLSVVLWNKTGALVYLIQQLRTVQKNTKRI